MPLIEVSTIFKGSEMDYKKLKEDFNKKKEKLEKESGELSKRSSIENAIILDALKEDSLVNDMEHDRKIEELEKNILPSGSTGDRPSSPVLGQPFFDTDLGKAIIYNGSDWVGFDGEAL